VHRYIPELDGIRAIAVLLVITVHMHTHFWEACAGSLGVQLFFVLSGYLITSLALREETRSGRLSFRSFYIRRAFRIFPLYYLVLAVYCLLIFGLHVAADKRPMMFTATPYFLIYMQELPLFKYGAGHVPFYQTWSLGIEEKYYLAWPAIAFFALRSRRALRLPVVCGLALLATLFSPLIASYACILAGCALALALEKPLVRKIVRRAGAPAAYAAWLSLIGLHIFVMPIYPHKLDLFYSALACICFATLLLVPTAVNSLLAWRPLVAIGKVSYGIYLVHVLCLNVAEHIMQNRVIPSLLAAVLLSCAIAYALHLTVEKPLIRFGRKLASRYSLPVAAANLL
jgi:peptidoglycan/LPS O-acetylase OafA/YrhL